MRRVVGGTRVDAGPGRPDYLQTVSGDGRPAERDVPWSEKAEVCFLGGVMMTDRETAAAAVDQVEVDHLYKEAHRRILRAYKRILARGEPCSDVVTLAEELKAANDMEAVGGPHYLANLVDAVPSAENIEDHARIVRRKAVQRRALELLNDLWEELSKAGPAEVSDVLERIGTALEELDVPDGLDGVDLVRMSDWLEDPDDLAPPNSIAHGLLYEGQVILIYADPKSGKTTVAIAVTAAVSAGRRFLGHPTIAGPVLYLAAEGDRNEILRRLHEFGAEPANVDVVVPGQNPITELRTLMDARNYRVVVFDTLGKWMAPTGVDRWKQSEVDTVLSPVERIIRESGAVGLAIHHANAEGKPIDSTAFAAWADVLRKVEDGEGPQERRVTGRARFSVPDLRFRLIEDDEGSQLMTVDPNRSLDERILDFVDVNPDCSKSAIRDGVSGSRKRVDKRLERLVERGIISREETGRSHKYRIAENPHSHGTATVRHGNRHGGVGNGGGKRGDGGERDTKYLSPSATPRRADEDSREEPSRCDCGTAIGPSAEQCVTCKRAEDDR